MQILRDRESRPKATVRLFPPKTADSNRTQKQKPIRHRMRIHPEVREG
ncbi:hypothetical protein QUB33_19735 [Microcoleus sp. B3-A4]